MAAGVFTGEGPYKTELQASHEDERRAPARRAPTATATCTMPWTITHGWRTRRSSTTNARRPRPGSRTRANAFFASIGVTVTAVMTDNGACYRSHAFADALGDTVKHKWTKPYRPQTNGKVERFNRTLSAEWAYAKPYADEAERTAAYETWLHHYNHHRPHTGIDGQIPSARVHNLTGKYS